MSSHACSDKQAERARSCRLAWDPRIVHCIPLSLEARCFEDNTRQKDQRKTTRGADPAAREQAGRRRIDSLEVSSRICSVSRQSGMPEQPEQKCMVLVFLCIMSRGSVSAG